MFSKIKALACLGLLPLVLIVSACASSPAANNIAAASNEVSRATTNNEVSLASNAHFADILSRDWSLQEIRSGSNIIRIDRTMPGTNSFFTIRFDDVRLNGTGAPNRYLGSYTRGEGSALSIELTASTQMAALFENEYLKEHEYYSYLDRVSRWNIQNGYLELYTSNQNGIQTVLIFL